MKYWNVLTQILSDDGKYVWKIPVLIFNICCDICRKDCAVHFPLYFKNWLHPVHHPAIRIYALLSVLLSKSVNVLTKLFVMSYDYHTWYMMITCCVRGQILSLLLSSLLTITPWYLLCGENSWGPLCYSPEFEKPKFQVLWPISLIQNFLKYLKSKGVMKIKERKGEFTLNN